jgi:hypothetical protein
MGQLKKSDPEKYAHFEINLVNFPTLFELKKAELIRHGFTEKEAIENCMTPIEMELVFAPDQGVFAVESEAMEDTDIFNPYDGQVMLDYDGESWMDSASTFFTPDQD